MSSRATRIVSTPDLLATVCRIYAAGRISERIFSAAVIEALDAGVDAAPVLTAAGIRPDALPRYATLVAAGFFERTAP